MIKDKKSGLTSEITLEGLNFLLRVAKSGITIMTSDELKASQDAWSEYDYCKVKDCSANKFYITTDCGQEPMGYDTIEEILSVPEVIQYL